MSIHPGVDRFLEQPPFAASTRFALVTNDGACTADYIPSRQALLARGHRIVKLFSPEHGLHAIGPDGQTHGRWNRSPHRPSRPKPLR